jgi:hypothetical protein
VKHLVNGEYCPLQCILCMKTFVKKCNLETHHKICNGHLDDIGGKCEICFTKFQYKIDLSRHRKSFMNTDGSFKFNCGHCEKKNCSFDMLGDHIKSNSAIVMGK